jgi:hypothetical protein
MWTIFIKRCLYWTAFEHSACYSPDLFVLYSVNIRRRFLLVPFSFWPHILLVLAQITFSSEVFLVPTFGFVTSLDDLWTIVVVHTYLVQHAIVGPL